MKWKPLPYSRNDDHRSQLSEAALKKVRFQNELTEERQVIEIGGGTGYFARQFLLPHCRPCRRLVATDLDPEMVEFATEHFSHQDIVRDVLDIVTPDLTPFLEKYGKFQRAFAFLVFHVIQDQRAAYENIAKLLTDDGECLVVAYSSFDLVDLWKDVYDIGKWKGVIPDPRSVLNASFNFNQIKTTAQVESEARDTVRGTGLECISCEVYDTLWKYDSLDTAVDMFLTVVPFKDTVPAEEWEEFRNLWLKIARRKMSPIPGKPVEVKHQLCAVHTRRSNTDTE
ncbi:juvenile hormone acid O-methyltransferase [Rhipicephalus sanguineus]|uniref:Methyltransferase type 12 domain-containing protein n=1 Tax=Rhipicephalus sanguineus TaxID=34632 RepID=A0A9D4PHJ6_RHISA|nr:juvenile hormone acid O-methyltransferase [Rhipicephalus sanguineus]KAH7942889.1 hypothetical protein HPB52_002066 [Rhipicephalus sanguineus]